MENFDFYSPTYFAFGKNREADCGELVKRFGGSIGGFVPLNQQDVEAIYRLML